MKTERNGHESKGVFGERIGGWSEIAAFHTGDNPGRTEPGDGEMNDKYIFRHIDKKDYKGALCCEHGHGKPGKEGERAMIDAYRVVDNFQA